jgi:hypothetical protein
MTEILLKEGLNTITQYEPIQSIDTLPLHEFPIESVKFPILFDISLFSLQNLHGLIFL